MKKVLIVIIALLFAFSVTASFAADQAVDTKAAPTKIEQKKDADKKEASDLKASDKKEASDEKAAAKKKATEKKDAADKAADTKAEPATK